ncbi:MAG: ATP-dependent DNA helicase RecQ [Flavobacteriales bacterium]
MEAARQILQQYWGYSEFRASQEPIVAAALAGKDTLALLPTGGGKSICCQVPGLAREGICVVVSPLIALMQDQVENLQQKGIRAKAITSGMSYKELDQTLDNARFGGLDFLYTSPERLQSALFIERFKRMKVSLLVVDEAHCISEWGHDFRPSFRQIAKLRKFQPEVPILALTATATKKVQADILNQLEMPKALVLEAPFIRENLQYLVRHAENKIPEIVAICQQTNEVGIVYCQTRKNVKEVARQLHANGISCGVYHGGMSAADRSQMLKDWLSEKRRVMVATNAFGMGIDKPNVRFVLHYEVPTSPEAYFQEAGRAGRDGQTAYALLFYNDTELAALETQVAHRFPAPESVLYVYRALANYLKIAIGSGKDEAYPFDLHVFCQTFELKEQEVFYALKLLEQNGNISLSESFFQQPRVQFIVSNEVLYNFQIQHEQFQALCTLLVRSYAGIFDQLTPIHEQQICKRLNISEKRLEEQMEIMQKNGLIEYSKKSNLPVLTLTSERLPESYFNLKPEIYLHQKQTALSKLQAMEAYCKLEVCRSQQLISYFGQQAAPCGHCDVCRPLALNEANLIAFLSSPQSLQDLQAQFFCSKIALESLIRPLLLTEKIKYSAGKFYL